MIKETQAQLMRSSLKVSAEVVLTRSFIFAAKDKQLGKTSDVTKVFCPTDTDARVLAQAEKCWPSAQVVSVPNVSEVLPSCLSLAAKMKERVSTTSAETLRELRISCACVSLIMPRRESSIGTTP